MNTDHWLAREWGRLARERPDEAVTLVTVSDQSNRFGERVRVCPFVLDVSQEFVVNADGVYPFGFPARLWVIRCRSWNEMQGHDLSLGSGNWVGEAVPDVMGA